MYKMLAVYIYNSSPSKCFVSNFSPLSLLRMVQWMSLHLRYEPADTVWDEGVGLGEVIPTVQAFTSKAKLMGNSFFFHLSPIILFFVQVLHVILFELTPNWRFLGIGGVGWGVCWSSGGHARWHKSWIWLLLSCRSACWRLLPSRAL